jgi:hypothetical protein
MTLSGENLSRDLPLLEHVLSPDKLSSVLLAIKTQDSSKLPVSYNTSCRILTNPDQLETSESDNDRVNLLNMPHTDCARIQKLDSAAALQLPALGSSILRDSTVGPVVVNKLDDEVYCIDYFKCVKFKKTFLCRRLKLVQMCSRLLGKSCQDPTDTGFEMPCVMLLGV